ncbi:extracellular conserved serine-rich protein [Colletotrichum tofieldiae]|nr:extracellular conserved serine-rich protein [Colletotrichum tofieldiae]GKT69132.1 extracellular conserved serine-rich protein [Colletotrichum tofieldiae]GKT96576.1 extracellular conserved serine-rich protein [Colletotrichum tofieldiae]
MFSKTAVAITSLLALAEAVKVTKPAKGDDWEISSTNEITWETVSSDPTSFEIVIVNQSGYPPVSEKIAKVNAADGKYELKDVKVAAGDAYRINLISTENSGILAQSDEFSLTSDDSDNSSSASASATPSASASGSASASATGSSSSASGSTATATVTQTSSGLTTVTGSATASASGTAASNASGSGTASGTATGSAASGTSTTAPNSASGLKSTFAIFGSVAVAAYMLF